MSKNLTRKGIAFGALVALGSSIFATAPAHAIDPVSLDPTAGTSYSTLVGESFSLTSLFTNAAHLGAEKLNFLVTDASSVLNVAATTGTTTAFVPGTATTATAVDTNKQIDFEGGNLVAPNSNVIGLKATAAGSLTVQAYLDYNGNHKLDAGETASAVRTVTYVAVASATATTTITNPLAGDTSAVAKVSFDGLNNEQITTGHVATLFTKGDGSAYYTAAITSVTVASNVATYATSANNLAIGDVVTVTGFSTSVYNVSNAVVTGRSAGNFTVALTTANGTESVAAAATATRVQAVAAWSATDKFKATATVPALVAAQAVKVQVLYSASGTPAAANTIGTAVTALVSATSVNTIVGSIAASNVSGSGSTAFVAPDAAFTVNLVAKDATTPTALVVAGKTVTYTVTLAGAGANWLADAATYAASTSTTKATVTINGVTYTNAADLATANTATFSGVTDANGNIAVAISSKNIDAAATITVAPSIEHATATNAVAIVQALTYTATPANSYSSIVAGGSSSATVSVVDQFGKVIADGYTAIATITSTGRTTAATGTVTAAVVAGKATLNFVDNGVGTGTNTYAIAIKKQDPTTLNYSVVPAGSPAATATVYIKNAADLVPGKIVLGGAAVVDATVATKYTSTGATIDTATFGSYDPAGVLGTPVTPSGAGVLVTGTVSSASTATYAGVTIAGATVTVASAGALFKDNVSNRFATDSITVQANNSGVFNVQVFSHKSGDITYTVTSGATVDTYVVTYNAPAANTGADVVIATTPVATALPGTTVKVVATVVDKFGNTVATVANGAAGAGVTSFKLVIAGIGAGSTDDTTNVASAFALTSGSVTKYIVLGASDTGTLTATATYDADGTTTTIAAVTKTASVVVALPAAAKTSVVAGASQAQVGAAVDVTATATDAAGKPAAGVVVSFTVAGQGYLSTATATTNAAGVATVKLVSNVAGMNTVSAAANGSAAATTAVTFGNADANLSFSKSKHSAIVNFEFAGNAKVVVSVNGARVKTVYPADDMVGSIKVSLKKGKNKVTVSVAGVVTDARTVTTK
jgi:hypothetical protein